MPIFEKHFSLEQANALLPEIRDLFAEIYTEIERIEANEGELAKRALEALPTNGGGQKVEAFFQASHVIQERLVQIHKMGVQVKDVRRGLVDFPALRDGEEILLCWLVEEPQVRFWHDLENGFPSRQPLD